LRLKNELNKYSISFNKSNSFTISNFNNFAELT
jgi:hypothetical protein